MIIAFSGPSGIGKGFVKERLIKNFPFIEELAWFTTRPLRQTEHGSNRISVAQSEFDGLVESGVLILVQNIYGNSYGLKKDDLLPGHKIRLTEFHPDNLSEALKINPGIIAIGLVTPDLSLLQKRLSFVRKTESVAEIEKRIAVAKTEIQVIMSQRSLFASVIEVTKASEDSIFDQVLEVLTPHLEKKGR